MQLREVNKNHYLIKQIPLVLYPGNYISATIKDLSLVDHYSWPTITPEMHLNIGLTLRFKIYKRNITSELYAVHMNNIGYDFAYKLEWLKDIELLATNS